MPNILGGTRFAGRGRPRFAPIGGGGQGGGGVSPLTFNVPYVFEGYGADHNPYNGETISGTRYTSSGTPVGDDIVRVQRLLNFEGGGGDVWLKRICRYDPVNASHLRAEFGWFSPKSGASSRRIRAGVGTWFAMAFRFNEWPAAATVTNDRQSLYQIHQEVNAGGDTGASPPFLARIKQESNQIEFLVIYDAGSPTGSGTQVSVGTVTRPANGTWFRIIMYRVSGWTTAMHPRMKIWYVTGASTPTYAIPTYSKVADTDFNAFNCIEDEYPKIGIYKWTDNVWGTGESPETRSFYHSNAYQEEGDDTSAMFDRAVASVAPFAV